MHQGKIAVTKAFFVEVFSLNEEGVSGACLRNKHIPQTHR